MKIQNVHSKETIKMDKQVIGELLKLRKKQNWMKKVDQENLGIVEEIVTPHQLHDFRIEMKLCIK